MKAKIHEICFPAGALPRTPLAEASIPNNLGAIPPFRFLPCPPVELPLQFLSCLLLLQISPINPSIPSCREALHEISYGAWEGSAVSFSMDRSVYAI